MEGVWRRDMGDAERSEAPEEVFWEGRRWDCMEEGRGGVPASERAIERAEGSKRDCGKVSVGFLGRI